MADSQLTLVARRDDGAWLVEVAGSGCVLTVAADDDGELAIWADLPDVVAARGNWQATSDPLPAQVAAAASAFVAEPGWCATFDD